MKKRLMCLLMLVMLLLPLAAQAFSIDSEGSWNKLCKCRTTRSTTLYSLSFRDDKHTWGPDERMEDDAIFTPIGTLAAGKWVSVISSEMCGKREVFYWNGGRCSAWIDEDAYTRDTVTITSTTGQRTSIPRKAYGDADAVRYILSEFLSSAEVEAYIQGMRNQINGSVSADSSGSNGSSTGGDAGSTGSTTVRVSKQGKSLALPTITLTTTGEDGTAASAEVQLVQPGLLTSVVAVENGERIVPTLSLSWERGEAEHAVAVVYAPNSGLANLWEKSTGKNSICKLKAGSVVLVLEKGGKYTMVMGDGKAGYVLTSALNLMDPAAEGSERTAVRKLTLRLEAKNGSRSLTSIPKDTVVTVLQVKGNWALVEYEGLVGYVQERYLKN